MRKASSQKGFGLVEIIIGSAIMAIAIVGLISSYNIYVSYAFKNQYNVRAGTLIEEGIEATKIMRDTNWTSSIATLTNGATYYFNWNGTTWVSASTSPGLIDSVFDRKFTVSAVNRDGNSDIVTSGGMVDTGTKLVTVSVSYRYGSATTTQSVSTYITNLQNN